jgi:hypothetical protein
MSVATDYETARGATVLNVSSGSSPALRRAIEEARPGVDPLRVASADLVSRLGAEIRIIEVKARGAKGPIDLPERQLETFAFCGDASWLYVVWNATQKANPCQLWAVQDPARMPWVVTQAALRSKEEFRGVRHEAVHRVTVEDVEGLGVRVV